MKEQLNAFARSLPVPDGFKQTGGSGSHFRSLIQSNTHPMVPFNERSQNNSEMRIYLRHK